MTKLAKKKPVVFSPGQRIAAENMRRAMGICDVSNEELAVRLGLKSNTSIVEWKNAVQPMTMKTIERVATALKMPFQWFLQENDFEKITESFIGSRVEKRPRAVNRRDDLAVFPITGKDDPRAIQIPRFENVAAGFSGEVERSPDLTYIRELPDARGIHSIVIRGDSMVETLQPHDLVLVHSFPNEGLELQPRGSNPKNSKKQLQQFVPDDELFIISLNEEGVRIKRIQYQGELDWKLQIVSDNPHYRVHTVTAEDKVIFYARVIGIGGPVPDWGKRK